MTSNLSHLFSGGFSQRLQLISFTHVTQEALCDLLDGGGQEILEVDVCHGASQRSRRAYWAWRRLGLLQVILLFEILVFGTFSKLNSCIASYRDSHRYHHNGLDSCVNVEFACNRDVSRREVFYLSSQVYGL